jgi:hypothetical protein
VNTRAGQFSKAWGRGTGRYLTLAAVTLSASATVFLPARGQQERQPARMVKGAESTKQVKAFVIDKNLTDLPKAKTWQPSDPIKDIPRRSYGRRPDVPKPEPRVDPLLGFQRRAAAANFVRDFGPPVINMDGQGFSGVNPPDTVGDVGEDHYIQAINGANGTTYTVYKKSDGSVAAGPFVLSGLGGTGGCDSGLGDPIVLYDPLAKRWLLSEFSDEANVLCVYISRTSDPVNGGWFNYHFATPHFPDYPHYGVWHDAYYVTSNEEDGPAVYALEREKMLDGSAATMQRFAAAKLAGFGFQALTASDLEGPAPPNGAPNYLMRHHDDEVHNVGSANPNQDFLDVYEFHVDWGSPTQSSFSGPVGIPVSEFDSHLCGLTSLECIPQKGSSIRLDPLREVIMNRLQYRNFGDHEALVGSFVTDVDGNDHAGVRWFELRKGPGESWTVHQEGTFAPDGDHRWMSSIAMDGEGNIALGYNASGDTTFPGLRYVGRLASDPMGTMPRGEHTLVKGAAANESNRYGDYAALSVDSNNLFWFTGQYNKAGRWSTRIGSFRFKPH